MTYFVLSGTWNLAPPAAGVESWLHYWCSQSVNIWWDDDGSRCGRAAEFWDGPRRRQVEERGDGERQSALLPWPEGEPARTLPQGNYDNDELGVCQQCCSTLLYRSKVKWSDCWFVQCFIVPFCLQWFDSAGWGVRKSIRPVQIEWWGVGVVICLERGADCLHMVQLMPLPSQNSIIFCLI